MVRTDSVPTTSTCPSTTSLGVVTILKGSDLMNATIQRKTDVINRLSGDARVAALRSDDVFTVSDDEDEGDDFDLLLFDESTAHDDGYRISDANLRKKYGI